MTAKTAAAEIAKKSDELHAAKAAVARLKMELSLSVKAKEDVESKVIELQSENTLLKSQVAQSQMAMKSTLEEAIKLLAEGECVREVTHPLGPVHACAASSGGAGQRNVSMHGPTRPRPGGPLEDLLLAGRVGIGTCRQAGQKPLPCPCKHMYT